MLLLKTSASRSACRRELSLLPLSHIGPSTRAIRGSSCTETAPLRWCRPYQKLWPAAESLHETKRASGTCAQSAILDVSWMSSIDPLAVARQLNMVSLLPYLAFLFFLTTSHKVPKLTLAGFWFVLVFVTVTIPAGMYATSQYGTVLANVDWLHGSTESLLTCCNLLIVLGLRRAIRRKQEEDALRASDKDTARDTSGARDDALGAAAMADSDQTNSNASGAMQGQRAH